jgi:DNA-binding MarR family transcriptional regulator
MQDAHISTELRTLHDALISIVGVMNRPQRDAQMVKEAGISLDRALFPLLVGVERLGPIGVVELADRVGRDYTTVSRQVAKLESLELIQRQGSATDGRKRDAKRQDHDRRGGHRPRAHGEANFCRVGRRRI